jgi:hypothetical protein
MGGEILRLIFRTTTKISALNKVSHKVKKSSSTLPAHEINQILVSSPQVTRIPMIRIVLDSYFSTSGLIRKTP